MLKHRLKLGDQLCNICLDVGGVLRPDKCVQRRQVLFDGFGHKFTVRQHIVVDLLLEGNYLQAGLVPLLPDGHEHSFVLGFCGRVLDDQPYICRILLDVKLP